jgi:hypothetical protein
MKVETKTVKHTYDHTEREQLGGDLARSIGAIRGIEAEFDGIKSSYKAKTAEAEARIDRLSTNISNGFDMREEPCVVTFRTKDKEKDYWLESDAKQVPDGIEIGQGLVSIGILPVMTERMTSDDFQQELIEAESKFDAREEIQLFAPAEGDRGLLVVGRFGGKWFGALRVKIGKLELNERLDSEQPCTVTRADAVKVAVKRVNDWAKSNLKDLAAGFQSSFNAVEKLHSERME